MKKLFLLSLLSCANVVAMETSGAKGEKELSTVLERKVQLPNFFELDKQVSKKLSDFTHGDRFSTNGEVGSLLSEIKEKNLSLSTIVSHAKKAMQVYMKNLEGVFEKINPSVRKSLMAEEPQWNEHLALAIVAHDPEATEALTDYYEALTDYYAEKQLKAFMADLWANE